MEYADIDQISPGSHLSDNGNESTTPAEGGDGLGYRVVSLDPKDHVEDHGLYETLDEAHGCVAYDHLKAYSIWHLGERVEDCEPYAGTDSRARQGLGQ